MNERKLRAWVDKVLDMEFEVIVPAHGASPVTKGKTKFRQAFARVLY